MERELDGPHQRRIRIQTHHGSIEGALTTSSGTSTMHYLNVISSSQNFLQIKPPVTCTGNWRFEDAPLAVATDSILFVTELAECVPTPGDPHAAARFKRARIRLRLDEYDIDGYVHVPPGGDPICDESNATFEIQMQEAIEVTAPENLESYVVGDPVQITWNATEVETVTIYYGDDSKGWTYITTRFTSGTGSFFYDWIAPDDPGDWFIKICDANDDDPCDIGDNTGETWIGGYDFNHSPVHIRCDIF